MAVSKNVQHYLVFEVNFAGNILCVFLSTAKIAKLDALTVIVSNMTAL